MVMSVKKLPSLLLLSLLLLFLLAACGEPPNSFVKSTNNELAYLSWNDNNGQLSGALIDNRQDALNGTSTENLPITGTLQNNHVTISAGPLPALTGDIDSNNHLQAASADSSGHSQQVTWYVVNQQDYNSLVTVFNAHMKLANLMQKVNQALLPPPQRELDSSSAAADSQVQADQSNIKNNDSLIQNLSRPYGCFGASAGLPQPSDNFQLADNAKNLTFATLNNDLQSVQQQWNTVKNMSIPSINIPMPWRITQQQIDKLVSQVSTVKQQTVAQINADQQQLDQLKAKYTSQVNQYNQTYEQVCRGK
jgi:hypothetical protein